MTINEEAVKEIIETVRDSKNFVLAQAPGVAREIITYSRASNILALIVALLFVGLAAKFVYLSKASTGDDGGTGWAIAAGLLFVIALIVIPLSIDDLIKTYVAPKLYILDYLLEKCRGK